MKKTFILVKKFLPSSLTLFLGLLTVPIVIVLAFVFTYAESPAVSELAFIEYSSDASVLGSVIPASCESGYAHYAGECTPPPPVVSLAASPGTINLGQAATLSWSVSGATSCTASGGWSGGKAAGGGAESVAPGATTNYGITCYGPGGARGASATVVVNPPSVSLTASPGQVDAGNTSTLTWVVNYASSCTASGGWSGGKSTSGGNENVSPSVSTNYTLTCNSSSGATSRTVRIGVPGGTIAATSCIIPAEASSCNSVVSWTGYDFFSTPEVSHGTATISSSLSGSLTRAVDPDNRSFSLRDTGGAFITSYNADITCALGSVWAGGRCVTLPVIDIMADPNIVRSGNTAPIEIEITANYDLTCNLFGGVNDTFFHSPSMTPVTYNFTTRPLTSAQIVRVECTSPIYPVVTGDAEVRVEVIPTVEEI